MSTDHTDRTDLADLADLADQADLAEHADRILDALAAIDPLGDLPRTGWLLGGITPAESVAAHTTAVALLTAMIVDELRAAGIAIDGERALRMALVHDVPEARTGDMPMPSKDPAVTAALHELERRIIAEILPPALAADWTAGEAGDSIEARVVAAADKIQMLWKLWMLETAGRAGHPRFARMRANPRNLRALDLAPVRAIYERLFARAGWPMPAADE